MDLPYPANSSPTGRIVQTFNRFFLVEVGRDKLLCQPKGLLKRHEDPDYRLPVIGDWVQLKIAPKAQQGVEGFILGILPRKNFLARAGGDAWKKTKVMAANMDRIFVVSAVKNPDINWNLIDRYLATCALLEIPASLLINKIDLHPERLDDPILQNYRDLGYRVFETSALDKIGGARLIAATESGISLFTGPSGVGKSSIINWLVPNAQLKVAAVSLQKGLGKHTTTSSVLIPVGPHGFLADSPGLRDFTPPWVPPDQLRFGFREIAEHQKDCRFPSCLHQNEPACAIRERARDGTIHPLRYRNYLALLQELQDLTTQRY